MTKKDVVSRVAAMGLLAGTLILQQGGTGQAQVPAVGSPPGDMGPAWSPTGELIAFDSTRDLKPEIYVMNTDGTAQRQLTTSAVGMSSSSPAWSPDGRRIAFVTGSMGGSQIFIMNADGSGQKLLASGRFNSSPAWAPEGRRIAFISNRTGSEGVYVIPAEGGDPVLLTSEFPFILGFSWSPDGVRLVLAGENSETETMPGSFPFPVLPVFKEQSVVEVVYASGRNHTTILRDAVWDSDPAWSPDGRRIAFESAGAIYAVNPDGSGRVQLTPREENSRPVWSPDARRIAFASFHDRKWQIFVMNADGSGRLHLNGPGEGDSPAWSPDGRRIVYSSKRGERWQLYSVNADGTGDTKLTEGY